MPQSHRGPHLNFDRYNKVTISLLSRRWRFFFPVFADLLLASRCTVTNEFILWYRQGQTAVAEVQTHTGFGRSDFLALISLKYSDYFSQPGTCFSNWEKMPPHSYRNGRQLSSKSVSQWSQIAVHSVFKPLTVRMHQD